ncbi:PE domain-containing protein [Mycobacterium haemophilum]|nr:PE domain-containing protein [Mycobacterium haemophilum]
MRNEVGMLISTVDPAELRQAADALYNLATDLHAGGVDTNEAVTKIVGPGADSASAYAALNFIELANRCKSVIAEAATMFGEFANSVSCAAEDYSMTEDTNTTDLD